MEQTDIFSLLPEQTQAKIAALGIKEPTAVQRRVFPLIDGGADILFQSETGTGKTFAYMLPLAGKLERNGDKTSVKILIAAPTFELASQINSAAKQISGRRTALLIGGAPIRRQIEALKEKPQIVIGTPARLVELAHLKKLKLPELTAVVLDEADRLVRRESADDTRELLRLAGNAQKIACSATITAQTRKFFPGAETVIMPPENVLAGNITHWAFYSERRDKIDTLRRFIAAENPAKLLVFTSRPDQVENIRSKLAFRKIRCDALHSKSGSQERKTSMDRFRSGKTSILITSDLAARGLDIPGITHIVQMDLPDDEDFFVHRSGRTARAGATGINAVIGDEFELRRLAALEKRLGIKIYPKQIFHGEVTAPQQGDD